MVDGVAAIVSLLGEYGGTGRAGTASSPPVRPRHCTTGRAGHDVGALEVH
jgi:hypothetical protein